MFLSPAEQFYEKLRQVEDATKSWEYTKAELSIMRVKEWLKTAHPGTTTSAQHNTLVATKSWAQVVRGKNKK
ncbi:hypothetical protein Q8F55_002933 [Vanrija albida]|uniref:Uncharacterized protein n=1 Tax=Vanrija albida TaxID=181172 RepID=A0ABR3QBA6_9TREE